jgi:preprotein translocase YajC subunit
MLDLFSNIKFYSLPSKALIVIAVIITFYCLIIIPAKAQLRQISFIKENLRPGLNVTMHNSLQGVVVLVLSKTVVIEQKNGVKIEVLKSAITDLNEQN